jgi:hypothetical protein
MRKDQELTNLEQLLDRVSEAAHDGDRVSLGAILEVVGRRSFGPLLLVAGLVTLAPIIGDIPGMPTIMAVLVLLIAGQLLFRREHFWLPHWLLKRSVAQDKLHKALTWLRPPARFIDPLVAAAPHNIHPPHRHLRHRDRMRCHRRGNAGDGVGAL